MFRTRRCVRHRRSWSAGPALAGRHPPGTPPARVRPRPAPGSGDRGKAEGPLGRSPAGSDRSCRCLLVGTFPHEHATRRRHLIAKGQKAPGPCQPFLVGRIGNPTTDTALADPAAAATRLPARRFDDPFDAAGSGPDLDQVLLHRCFFVAGVAVVAMASVKRAAGGQGRAGPGGGLGCRCPPARWRSRRKGSAR